MRRIPMKALHLISKAEILVPQIFVLHPHALGVMTAFSASTEIRSADAHKKTSNKYANRESREKR